MRNRYIFLVVFPASNRDVFPASNRDGSFKFAIGSKMCID